MVLHNLSSVLNGRICNSPVFSYTDAITLVILQSYIFDVSWYPSGTAFALALVTLKTLKPIFFSWYICYNCCVSVENSQQQYNIIPVKYLNISSEFL